MKFWYCPKCLKVYKHQAVFCFTYGKNEHGQWLSCRGNSTESTIVEMTFDTQEEFDAFMADPARKEDPLYDEDYHQAKIWEDNYTPAKMPSTTIGGRVSCPFCKATSVSKIGTVSRSVSFGIFGFGSSKIGKQWHCNKCGGNF